MKHIHNLTQGSPEWLAYRAGHFNASEAAAMLGLSRNMTRNELLHMQHTGIGKEFSDWVQRNVLDHGHAVEALVRPLIEAMIGEDLYPVTCSAGRLSASLDGLTMGEDIAFECKQWNAHIAAEVAAGVMPEQHLPQCQQILLITGAQKLIFAVGDGTPERLLTLEVLPDPAWFERLRAGWAQFEQDLAVYAPPAAVIEVVGHTPETLPALRIEVTGMVTASNLADYRAHALAVFGAINRELHTDQQFADAEKVVKWCGEVESRLAAAKQHALSQTESIDALFRTIDDISAEAKRVRLELDKLVAARKLAVRGDIVAGAVAALRGHLDALNQRLGGRFMPAIASDFGGAVKGLRTLASLHNAVNTELSRAKIEADAMAERIQANLATVQALAADHPFLFLDELKIVLKAPDDLTALVRSRIADYAQQEAARLQAEAVRVSAEAAARLDADAAIAQAAALPAASAAAAAEPLAFPVLDQAPLYQGFAAPSLAPDAGDAGDAGAVMSLGQLNARIGHGFSMSAEFLRFLGFEPAERDKKRPTAVLYQSRQFPAILAALARHANALAHELQAA